MEDGIPDTYSPWADEGSVAHFIGALCLEKGVSPSEYLDRAVICWEKPGERDGQVFAGEKLPAGAKERSRWTVDEEMVTNLIVYVGNVLADVTEGGELLVEQRVSFGSAIGVKGAFGTSDAIIVYDGKEDIFVKDLKYGRKPVSPTHNSQGMLYALGVLEDYGMMYDLDKVKRVWIQIIQPRINSAQNWVTSPEDLAAFAQTCKAAIVVAEEAISTMDVPNQWYDTKEEWQAQYLKYSEKGCTWCKAKGGCPEFARNSVETVLKALPATVDGLDDLDAEYTVESVTSAQTLALPQETFESVLIKATKNIHMLDLDTLTKLYKASALFDEFRDAVAQRLHFELMNGATHPDFKLVRGRAGNRKWSSPEEAEETLKSMRLKVDEMYTKKVISPSTAEKLLAKTSPKKWSRAEALIVREEGKITIAPADDKRDAYVPVAVLEGLPDLPEIESASADDDLDDLV
jgi:hypothetical protein